MFFSSINHANVVLYENIYSPTAQSKNRPANSMLWLDSTKDPNFHSNYNETCPKSKFFSLLIYAGYPA